MRRTFRAACLARGAHKFAVRKADATVRIPEADALHLPLRNDSLDLIVTAFGFRNLANYEAGLREFHRVLKPGGQLGILEFSEPGGLIGKAYAVYFRRVLPAIGRIICGSVPGNGRAVQLSAHLGRQLSAARRDAAPDARNRLCGVRLAAVHLWDCRVVHGHARACSLEPAMNQAISSASASGQPVSNAPGPRTPNLNAPMLDLAAVSAEKRRVALHSMSAAAAMTLLKLAAGLFSGSLGVLSDAAHSGLDLVGSALTFFSVRVSDKPADEDHTYGHGKIENLSAFGEAGLMAVSCAWIIWEAIERIFFHAVVLRHSVWPVLVLLTVDRRGLLALAATARRGAANRLTGAGHRRLSFCLRHLGHAGGAGRAGRHLGGRALRDRLAALSPTRSPQWWFRS